MAVKLLMLLMVWEDSNWDSSEAHASLTSSESDGYSRPEINTIEIVVWDENK
jgi:hypothetical protein